MFFFKLFLFRTIGFRRICLAVVCLLWLGALAVRAADHYVSLAGTNDSAGQYTNWAGAATQIQWAVNFATNSETVWVSNGIYYLTNQISITNSIALRSFSGSYTNTIINGNYPAYTNNNRGVYINNSGAVLDGFTITNCFTTNQAGAGFYAAPVKLITNCLITGNMVTQTVSWVGEYAGGYALSGTVSHCRFIGNKITGSGGRYCGLVASASIVSNCIIAGNESRVNGGSYAAYWGSYGGNATAVNCVISGNISMGVRIDDGSCLLSSIVSNNTGKGISMGGARVRNCLVVQNGSDGCEISYYNVCQIDNCTIANNGGYGVYYNWGSGYVRYIANSIIYNNKTANWGYAGTNIVYTNCCTIPIPTNMPGNPQGTDNITNTPLFTDTNIANYRLSANSPCINAGTNRTWMINSFDLDARPRIRYGRVDIGAYEYINNGTLYKFH